MNRQIRIDVAKEGAEWMKDLQMQSDMGRERERTEERLRKGRRVWDGAQKFRNLKIMTRGSTSKMEGRGKSFECHRWGRTSER